MPFWRKKKIELATLRKVYGRPELTESEGTLEIIVIPGSRYDDPTVWTGPNSTAPWLMQLLNMSHVDKAQVWVYDYIRLAHKPATFKDKDWRKYYEEGEDFLAAVKRLPSYPQKSDLLFICNSFGGFVMKRAMAIVDFFEDQDFISRLKGIMFLSSPHVQHDYYNSYGKTVMWHLSNTLNLRNPWPYSVVDPEQRNLQEAEFNLLWRICDAFEKMSLKRSGKPIPVLSVYETVGTPLEHGGAVLLVDETWGRVRGHVGVTNATNMPFARGHLQTCLLDPVDAPFQFILSVAVTRYRR